MTSKCLAMRPEASERLILPSPFWSNSMGFGWAEPPGAPSFPACPTGCANEASDAHNTIAPQNHASTHLNPKMPCLFCNISNLSPFGVVQNNFTFTTELSEMHNAVWSDKSSQKRKSSSDGISQFHCRHTAGHIVQIFGIWGKMPDEEIVQIPTLKFSAIMKFCLQFERICFIIFHNEVCVIDGVCTVQMVWGITW